MIKTASSFLILQNYNIILGESTPSIAITKKNRILPFAWLQSDLAKMDVPNLNTDLDGCAFSALWFEESDFNEK